MFNKCKNIDTLCLGFLHFSNWGEPEQAPTLTRKTCKNGRVVHAQITVVKTGLQHTTVVWYGGSCTNKHDKLTDNSIQVQKYPSLCPEIPY